MYKLQIVLVPPSARDSIVPNNFRMGSMDASQMMPGQNASQANMPQPNNEGQGQFQNTNMGNETSMMNFNSTFMTQLYQAPVNSKKFLHFTKPGNSLFDLSEEVQKKCERMYPNLSEPIEILSIQDSTGCDLDPDFVVKDVFNMDNVVRIILKDELEMDDSANTSLYRSSKRRKLNDFTQQSTSSAETDNQVLPQQQPNSILKIAKKRSTTSNIKGSVNNNLRISTPLANQIYPSKMSNNSDDEGDEDVGDRSFLPPPNQPQSPPIRISSGMDNYKRIRSSADDTVSRSEMVDPDKSKQQRIFSGTPVRTMMTPNRVMLTGQRVVSENLGGTAPAKQGLIFASTTTQPGTRNLSPVFSPRITSGSLAIPEPKISEVERELREGPASPASVLPAKALRNPIKKPYMEKSATPDSDSTADTEDPQDSISFINDKSTSKESPFNQTSSQSDIDVPSKSQTNVPAARSLANTMSSPATTSVKRKSSLESKLQNKSFTTFSQKGREEEFRRMDHFSDEDDEEEENQIGAKPAKKHAQKPASVNNTTKESHTNSGEYDDTAANDTVQHIDLTKSEVKSIPQKSKNASLSKQKLMHMMDNVTTSNPSTQTSDNRIFEKPEMVQQLQGDVGSDSVIIDNFSNTNTIPNANAVVQHYVPHPPVQNFVPHPQNVTFNQPANYYQAGIPSTTNSYNSFNTTPSHSIPQPQFQNNLVQTGSQYSTHRELLNASTHDPNARQLHDLYTIFLNNTRSSMQKNPAYAQNLGIPSRTVSNNTSNDDLYSLFVEQQRNAISNPVNAVQETPNNRRASPRNTINVTVNPTSTPVVSKKQASSKEPKVVSPSVSKIKPTASDANISKRDEPIRPIEPKDTGKKSEVPNTTVLPMSKNVDNVSKTKETTTVLTQKATPEIEAAVPLIEKTIVPDNKQSANAVNVSSNQNKPTNLENIASKTVKETSISEKATKSHDTTKKTPEVAPAQGNQTKPDVSNSKAQALVTSYNASVRSHNVAKMTQEVTSSTEKSKDSSINKMPTTTTEVPLSEKTQDTTKQSTSAVPSNEMVPTKTSSHVPKKTALEKLEMIERSRALRKPVPTQTLPSASSKEITADDSNDYVMDDISISEESVAKDTNQTSDQERAKEVTKPEETSIKPQAAQVARTNGNTKSTESVSKTPAIKEKTRIVAEVQKLAKESSQSPERKILVQDMRNHVRPKSIAEIKQISKDLQPDAVNVPRTKSDGKNGDASVVESSDNESSDSDVDTGSRSSRKISIGGFKKHADSKKETNLVRKLLGKPTGNKIDLADLEEDIDEVETVTVIRPRTAKPSPKRPDVANKIQNTKPHSAQAKSGKAEPSSDIPPAKSATNKNVTSDSSDDDLYSSDSSFTSSSDDGSDSDSSVDSRGRNRVIRLPRATSTVDSKQNPKRPAIVPTSVSDKKKHDRLDSDSETDAVSPAAKRVLSLIHI